MMEHYQISLLQMMENAGLQLAVLARELYLDPDLRQKRILALAGAGGNGGGVLTAARRLAAWGAGMTVILSKPPKRFRGAPALQLEILGKIGVEIILPNQIRELPAADLILDGLIGYGLAGDPRGETAKLIRWVNQKTTPVISLDTPSGLDTTSGVPADPCISADATLTLALPKTGLLKDSAGPLVGDLYLADISVPPELYRELGLEIGPIFAEKPLLRV